jgi:hypothetical protein
MLHNPNQSSRISCLWVNAAIFCSVSLQLCINRNLGTLSTEHLLNGEQPKEVYAVTET